MGLAYVSIRVSVFSILFLFWSLLIFYSKAFIFPTISRYSCNEKREPIKHKAPYNFKNLALQLLRNLN